MKKLFAFAIAMMAVTGLASTAHADSPAHQVAVACHAQDGKIARINRTGHSYTLSGPGAHLVESLTVSSIEIFPGYYFQSINARVEDHHVVTDYRVLIKYPAGTNVGGPYSGMTDDYAGNWGGYEGFGAGSDGPVPRPIKTIELCIVDGDPVPVG